MSWARVLNEHQVRTLSCLYSSAAPSVQRTGTRLQTVQSLMRLGLVETRRADDDITIDPYAEIRVTPSGFRAWADILEDLKKERALEAKAVRALAAATVPRLPRCPHGNALQDHGGDALMPSCGCLGKWGGP